MYSHLFGRETPQQLADFGVQYPDLLQQIVCPQEAIDIVLGAADFNHQDQAACVLECIFPHLQHSKYEELLATILATRVILHAHAFSRVGTNPPFSEALTQIKQFVVNNSAFKMMRTGLNCRENFITSSIAGHRLLPYITLTSGDCGISPSVFYVRSFEEFRINDESLTCVKGKMVEQLRACLLADPSRPSVWGRVIVLTPRCVIFYFCAQNPIAHLPNATCKSIKELIVLDEYLSPPLGTSLGKQWFFSFLLASDADLGLTASAFKFRSPLFRAFKFGRLLGQGSSGHVYEAVRESDGLNVAVKIYSRERREDYVKEKANLARIAAILQDAPDQHLRALVPTVVADDDENFILVSRPVGEPFERLMSPKKLNLESVQQLFVLFELLSAHGVYTDWGARNVVFVNTAQHREEPRWSICVIDWTFWVKPNQPAQFWGTLLMAAEDIIRTFFDTSHGGEIFLTAAHGLESLLKFVFCFTVMTSSQYEMLMKLAHTRCKDIQELMAAWSQLKADWGDILQLARQGDFRACLEAVSDKLRHTDLDRPLKLILKQ